MNTRFNNPEEIELKNRLIHLASKCDEDGKTSEFLDLMKSTMDRNILDDTIISVVLNIFYTRINETNTDLKAIVNQKLIDQGKEQFILP